ncbi:MAG: AAA family ATPase [Nannocystales bacterium]
MKRLVESIEAGVQPSIAEFVAGLGDVIPAMRQLESTPQDPGWHAEGNVFIHTGMVLDALYELLATRAASVVGPRRTALILAAALHDVAKPLTTRPMEIRGVQRTAAPRHEMRGRSMLSLLLMEQGLDYRLIEGVADLVGYHVAPKFLVVKGRERGAYLRLAQAADPELLYWLELADMIGRTCVDQRKQIEHIEMFGLFAQEYGAWRRFADEAPAWRAMFRDGVEGTPAMQDLSHGQFIHDLCAGTVSQPEEGIARSYRFRQGFPELVITVGPSGSGKSTWVKRHLEDHVCISLDDIRSELGGRGDQSRNGEVRRLARERLREGLRQNRKTVWDATSLRRDFRDSLTKLAFDYGALVTLVCFPRAPRTYHRRNRERDNPVPASVLDGQIEVLQWPSRLEGHRWLVVDEDGAALAYYGGLGEELPYGAASARDVLREWDGEAVVR